MRDEEVQIKGPLDALNRGIAMVHQELQPIPERSIGENIYVGRYPNQEIRTRHRHRPRQDVRGCGSSVLKEVHLNYDPHAKLGTLERFPDAAG